MLAVPCDKEVEHLRGFVPQSHIAIRTPSGNREELVGQTIPVKFIEVDEAWGAAAPVLGAPPSEIHTPAHFTFSHPLNLKALLRNPTCNHAITTQFGYPLQYTRSKQLKAHSSRCVYNR